MPTCFDNVGRKDRILSREYVKNQINNGQTIIIVDGYALRVDAWLRYHPGGDKAIMHMVGKDATDEVNAYVIIASYIFRCTSSNEWQTTFVRCKTKDE